MGSRYAQSYGIQAALVALFQRAGYTGEAPSFLASQAAGADHPLLAWMASSLRVEEHFMREEDVAMARAAAETADADEGKETVVFTDDTLAQFEEAADDVASAWGGNDQGAPHGSAMHDMAYGGQRGRQQQQASAEAGWLEEESLPETEARLAELAEERTLYKQQLQELAALEAQLDEAQRTQRARTAADKAALEGVHAMADAERRMLTTLDAQLNGLLHELHEALLDVRSLAATHAAHWLVLVKSADKDAYLQQSSTLMAALLRCNLQQGQQGAPGGGDGFSLPAEDGEPALAPGDDPSWLEACNPFGAVPMPKERIRRGLDASEDRHMISELTRLTVVRKQTESDCVLARLAAAQHAAELDALRGLVADGARGGGGRAAGAAGGSEAAQEASLAEEIERLEGEESRLAGGPLQELLEQLVRQHEAEVLQGHYQLQLRVLDSQLHRRAALVRTLLEQSARHQLIQAVQAAEHDELQALYAIATALERTLGSVASSASTRCSLYEHVTSRAAAECTSAPAAHAAAAAAVSSSAGGALARLDPLLEAGGSGGGGGSAACARQLSSLEAAASVAARLCGLQADWAGALRGVSDGLYGRLPELLSQSRAAAQDAHDMLFPPGAARAAQQQQQLRVGGGGGGGGGPPKVTLHPQALAEALFALRMAACDVNSAINEAAADDARAAAAAADSRGEVSAERSVLEWFHLEPHRLIEYIAGVEEQLAAMRM